MKNLKALLPYLARYRRPISWGLVMVVASGAGSVASVEFVMEGVDALGRPGASRGLVFRLAALSVLFAVLGGAARYGMREILNGVSRKVETDLRDDFFAHLMRLDASFYAAHPTGEIMSRATNDIQAVRMVAGPAYMYLVHTVVFGTMAAVRMALLDPWMTLWSLLPLVALPPVTVAFGNLIHRRFEKIQDQLGSVSTFAQENLAGQRIVKAYRQEEDQTRRFRALSREYMDRNVDLARTSGFFYPLLGLLGGLATALALALGGRAIMRGTLSTGELVGFLMYLGQLMWPMIALGWVVNLFQRGAASMGRVSAVLEAVPAVASPGDPRTPGLVRGEVEFRGVSFRYPGTERWVLRGVSFTIPAGSTVAVVGATGSGKSTLAALLVRLYDPTEGEVLLDGVPLPAWDLGRLRRAIAVVPQDTFLFSTTIAENLALGFDEEDAGERLARIRDAAVLVLDDALSAVDTHTEHEILEGLRRVLAGRTSVIVSHRVTAVMHADLILVLDGGRVAERGTHGELLRLGGVYAALQRRQLLAEAVEGDDLLAASSGGV